MFCDTPGAKASGSGGAPETTERKRRKSIGETFQELSQQAADRKASDEGWATSGLPGLLAMLEGPVVEVTVNFCINWSISELNTQVNPTTCLGDTDC